MLSYDKKYESHNEYDKQSGKKENPVFEIQLVIAFSVLCTLI